jgi:hypothetical protein
MSAAQKLGVIDFINFIYNGHPEYTLIAVKAPLEQAINAYISISESNKTRERFDFKSMRMQDLPVKSLSFKRIEQLSIQEAGKDDSISRSIPFISIKGSE